VTLSDQDSGRSVDIAKGGTLSVRLQENPTTGYRWAIESSGGLQLAGDEFQPGGGAVGAAGSRVFHFRASTSGTNNLRLRLWRDWEGDSSVINRFSATVNVK